MSHVVLIPSLNPDDHLIQVVTDLKQAGEENILIIDDGSAPDHQSYFNEAESLGAEVLHHRCNRGKGEAIKTGIAHVSRYLPEADFLITVDSDGQHRIDDVLSLAAAAASSPDTLILGTRDLKNAGIPKKSRVGNNISSLYFRFLTGTRCDDTQTGLRVIPRSLFEIARTTPGSRYDYEMNFLIKIARGKYPLQFVPIHTIYLNNNENTHFRPFRDSLLFFKEPLRFLAASLSSSLIDLALFTIVLMALGAGAYRIMIATLTARCLSGLFNFFVNKHWSFGSKEKTGGELLRYGILFLGIMLCSGFAVTFLEWLFPGVFATIFKIFVDSVLFLVSYKLQALWVFRKKR